MSAIFKTYPKENAVRSPRYLRLVASLPCAHCGIEGQSQAAHADHGKGMGIKADDRFVMPLCGPRPGTPGCHAEIGTLAMYSKADRRALERLLVGQTLSKVAALNLWPLGLAMLTENDWEKLK